MRSVHDTPPPPYINHPAPLWKRHTTPLTLSTQSIRLCIARRACTVAATAAVEVGHGYAVRLPISSL